MSSNLPRWMDHTALNRTMTQDYALRAALSEYIDELVRDHTGEKRKEFARKYGQSALDALLQE